jgi:cell division protein FtsW
MADQSLPSFVDDPALEALAERRAARTRRVRFAVDPYLVVIVGALLSIGLMMVWSTTFFFIPNQSSYYFLQQIRSMVIGGVIMIVVSMIDYRIWKRLSIPLMALIILLLAAVLIFGTTLYGARRSLLNGAIQPSEPTKLVVILYMAAWLSSKGDKLRNIFYGIIPFTILVSIIGGLIVLEPDISTALLILITLSAMFFLAGADLIQIGVVAVIFVITGIFVVTSIPYAQVRFQSWLALIQDPVNAPASHSQNVIIAFLNGGLTGVGLGGSYQKFYNLSVPHTDSIFAVVGEELGLVGAGVVIALYVAFMVRGFRIAREAPDSFGALIAAGVTTAIIIEALYNIAVMAAAVPFAGVPLPFVSFGGSSLVTVMTGVGLLLSVSRGTARQAMMNKWARNTVGRILNLSGRDGGRSVPRVSRR